LKIGGSRNPQISPDLALKESNAVVNCEFEEELDFLKCDLWRSFVNGWFVLFPSISKPLGVLALAGTVARGVVAFAAWRTAFRNRLIGAGPSEQEVSS
jgi:hypothetical protein